MGRTRETRYALAEYIWESERITGPASAIVQTNDLEEAAALIRAGLPDAMRLRELRSLKRIGDKGTMVFGRDLLYRPGRAVVRAGGQVW